MKRLVYQPTCRRQIRAIALAATAIASNALLAGEWLTLAKLDANGSVLLIDTSTIAGGKSLRVAWLRSKFVKPEPIPENVQRLRPDVRFYSEGNDLLSVDCQRSLMARLKFVYRDSSGNIVAQVDSTENGRLPPVFSPIPTGSLGESIVKAVCSWKIPDEPTN